MDRLAKDQLLHHPQQGMVSGNAVSYTHLRAHETVLDLVCRLLLEKKKPQISTCEISDQHYDQLQ